MITYLIAQTTFQLNLKHTFKGKLIVWVQDYKLIIGYDLEELRVWFEEVYKGIYLSNDLKKALLPREIKVNKFNNLMNPILKLRHKEMLAENKRFEKENRKEKERAESEEEAQAIQETEDYLNETFGEY